MVLGITSYDTLKRTSVVLEAKQIPRNEEQMWSRSKFESFSLTNPRSGKVLRSLGDGSTTIEGVYLHSFIEKFVIYNDKCFYLLQSLPLDHDFFLPKRNSEATKECIWQENTNDNVEVGLFFLVCVIIAIIKYFLYYS